VLHVPLIAAPLEGLLDFLSNTFLLTLLAAMFDWQVEMATLTTVPKVARAATPPPPSTQQVVSFDQALTGSTRADSNDNLS